MSAHVRTFFEEFERAANDNDLEATERQFAEVFLNADPNGTMPLPRAMLLASLPQRRELFESIGLLRTRLVAVDSSDLDDHYVMAKTHWMAELQDGAELELSSTFVLRREGNSFRVVFYLNHRDIITAIRERRDAASTS